MVTSSRWNEAKLRLANMNPVRQTVGGQTTALIEAQMADGTADRANPAPALQTTTPPPPPPRPCDLQPRAGSQPLCCLSCRPPPDDVPLSSHTLWF